MATRILIRRDCSSNFTSVNPILALAEMSYVTDTGRMKIGDGVTDWNTLDYFTPALDDEFNDLDELLLNSDADEVLVYDTSEQTYVKMTRRNFLKGDSVKLVATIVDAKAITEAEQNDLIFVPETETTYRYEEEGVLYTANNKHILITGNAGDTRWLAVGGQFMVNELNLSDGACLKINDIKVVDEQQPSISSESRTAGGTYGSNEQNLINGLKTKLNSVLTTLRNHGLIEGE